MFYGDLGYNGYVQYSNGAHLSFINIIKVMIIRNWKLNVYAKEID